jgi:two-component system CheB/CheR fusion protein
VLLRLPVGLVLVDRHYDIQCINTAARRLLGIRGAALGEDIVHLVQGRLADALRAAIDAALRQEEATTLDEVPTEKAVPGETHYLQIACTAYPSGAEKGVPGSVLVVVTDTTRTALQRREQQEEIARHQEEIARLTTLVEQLSATNHEIQAANDDLAAITTTWRGANQELRFRVEEAHAASGEAETLNEELQATIEEMTVTNAELQTRNNEIQDLATSLEEQHRRLNAILSSIGEAVVVVDQTGQVVFRSTMFAQLFGATGLAFTPEDADGRPLPPERMPQQRLARGEEFQMQCTLCDAQGERRWFDVTGRPICGDAPHHDGVLVIHDITDRSPAHRTLPTTTGPCGRESGAPSGDAWTTE